MIPVTLLCVRQVSRFSTTTTSTASTGTRAPQPAAIAASTAGVNAVATIWLHAVVWAAATPTADTKETGQHESSKDTSQHVEPPIGVNVDFVIHSDDVTCWWSAPACSVAREYLGACHVETGQTFKLYRRACVIVDFPVQHARVW